MYFQPTAINERVTMLDLRHNAFPRAFAWRGRQYQVRRVEECWTEFSEDETARVERHGFRVRADEHVFELVQDARSLEWRVQRQFSPAITPNGEVI